MRELSGMIEILYLNLGAGYMGVCISKICQSINSVFVPFTTCKLYINKPVSKEKKDFYGIKANARHTTTNHIRKKKNYRQNLLSWM